MAIAVPRLYTKRDKVPQSTGSGTRRVGVVSKRQLWGQDDIFCVLIFFLLSDSFLTECSKHTYYYYVHTHNTYDTYSIYLWCGTHMLVWVIICIAFSVLFPVLILVLTLGTSPVLQPNDPLWSNMWGKEEGGRERKRR